MENNYILEKCKNCKHNKTCEIKNEVDKAMVCNNADPINKKNDPWRNHWTKS